MWVGWCFSFVGASLDPSLRGRYIKPLAGLFWSRSGGGARDVMSRVCRNLRVSAALW